MNIIPKRIDLIICLLLILFAHTNISMANETMSLYSDGSINAGHGVVHMPGAILDSACSIEVGNENQTIPLQNNVIELLEENTTSKPIIFRIRLTHCIKNEILKNNQWKNVRLSFLGKVDENDNKLFAVKGGALGLGMQLRNANNDIIFPGEEVYLNNIPIGSKDLLYSIRAKADSSHLESGMIETTIQLRFDYE